MTSLHFTNKASNILRIQSHSAILSSDFGQLKTSLLSREKALAHTHTQQLQPSDNTWMIKM